MASLTTRANGCRAIQFTDADGKRRTIHLGKMDRRQAESVRVYVERLADAVLAGHSPDRTTTTWLLEVGDRLREKLVAAGLVQPSEDECDAAETLGPFLERYIQNQNIKPRSRDILQRAADSLTAFFGSDRTLDSITVGHAAEYERWLAATGSKKGGPLATNTVRDRIKKAKQFFNAAVDYELIPANPLRKLKGSMVRVKAREYFITRQEADKVLTTCPDAEWRLIFALSRFGGLRCPSEHLALRWEDVLWDEGRMHVRSPKTEHHAGRESRLVPLFPELRPHLEAAFDLAPEGGEFVIRTHRNSNHRTRFEKIIKRAGLLPWPKLFHNLRASRQTELEEEFPLHVVCAWIGNSESVAEKHYLQVTDAHYEKALHYALQYVQESSEMQVNTSELRDQKTRENGHISPKVRDGQYTRRDSNPQPPVPKTGALSN